MEEIETASNVIELAAVLDSVRRLKDRSLKISIVTTQPVGSEAFAVLDDMTPKVGWFLFSANQFQESEIPKSDAPSELKTQSQRIRANLFVNWNDTDKSETFEAYYRRKTEKFIQQIQDEREPRF